MVSSASILNAMIAALNGSRVLFLTPDRLCTGGIAQRAKDITVEALEAHGCTTSEIEALFMPGTSDWHIVLSSGGWVFFFPVDELDPNEDVQNPDMIVMPDGKEITYFQWKQAARWQTAAPKKMLSAWERILDDD